MKYFTFLFFAMQIYNLKGNPEIVKAEILIEAVSQMKIRGSVINEGRKISIKNIETGSVQIYFGGEILISEILEIKSSQEGKELIDVTKKAILRKKRFKVLYPEWTSKNKKNLHDDHNVTYKEVDNFILERIPGLHGLGGFFWRVSNKK